jgi:putative nucleotidyltransferase with HDIG domain
LDDLVSVACSDAVLAGAVLQAANSVAFARSVPARDVREAVMYIGTTRACQVVLAAALKPVLTVRGGDALWRHSVESAAVAELLAERTKCIDPHEAYLLGLLHDVGKLLLSIAPAAARACKLKLTAAGVQEQVAEIITFGADHAIAGADVLRTWGLPDDYVAAVESHHEPERSVTGASALLYLVEFCTDSEEDLPSDVRLRRALDRTGLTLSDVNVTSDATRKPLWPLCN